MKLTRWTRLRRQRPANPNGIESSSPALTVRAGEARSGYAGSTPQNKFTSEDVYARARELEKLHPNNRHVRGKIRQQLQALRDAKLLIHAGSGVWRLP
jgi:hypothetical protein